MLINAPMKPGDCSAYRDYQSILPLNSSMEAEINLPVLVGALHAAECPH